MQDFSGFDFLGSSQERMHADIAHEIEGKVSGELTANQAVLDEWIKEYNSIQPNEAIGMKARISFIPYLQENTLVTMKSWNILPVFRFTKLLVLMKSSSMGSVLPQAMLFGVSMLIFNRFQMIIAIIFSSRFPVGYTKHGFLLFCPSSGCKKVTLAEGNL